MLLKRLTTNPFTGKPRPWKPWYGYLYGIVAVACLGVYVYQRINGGPVLPTTTFPSETYNQLIQKRMAASAPAAEPTPVTEAPSISPIAGGVPLTEVAKKALELLKTPSAPKKVSENLAVPFTTQAPNAVWDDTHKTMQEEASFLMVIQYYEGASDPIDPIIANAAFSVMIDAETKSGLDENLTASEFGTFAESYASMKFIVVDNPTIDQIKTYISAGTPVLVPVVTEKMNNEFYLTDAAIYHYVVIRGYDGENFITNDPGTRHGENYPYAQSVIMDAMGDWNGGDPAMRAKRILILEQK